LFRLPGGLSCAPNHCSDRLPGLPAGGAKSGENGRRPGVCQLIYPLDEFIDSSAGNLFYGEEQAAFGLHGTAENCRFQWI
jgi:hypothetical protein